MPPITRAVLEYDFLDPIQLVWRESEVPYERDRVELELRRQIISIDMNMWRLVRLVTVEIQAV